MGRVQKFRDLPEWPEFRNSMRDAGVDPNVVAEIGETEGDSLDLVETTITLDEAFGSKLNKLKKTP